MIQGPADHVRPHLRKIASDICAYFRGPVTVAEHAQMAMNSWEREWLLPYSSDELLIQRIRHAQQNCTRMRDEFWPASTYDEALMYPLMNELLERYEKRRAAMHIEKGLRS